MPGTRPPVRIVLADDHPVVLEGLKALIATQADLAVVGTAVDGAEVLAVVAEAEPDILVMDVSMPRLGGIEATARVRAAHPDVRVLALSLYEDRGYLTSLMEAGASGYVLKRVASGELLRAIRTVAGGGLYIDPLLAGKVLRPFLSRSRPPGAPGVDVLSAREEDVLRRIALGYNNREIATELRLSVKTIETYKARLMEKLGLGNRVDIVRFAIRQGWMQEGNGS